MTKRSKSNFWTDLAPWALNLVLVALITGCGGSTGTGTQQTQCLTPDCMPGGNNNPGSQTCASSSTTCNFTPGGGPITDPSTKGAANTIAAQNALGDAGNMVSAPKTAGQFAAVADQTPANLKTNSGLPDNSASQSGNGSGSSLASGAGGSTGGGSGGGSSSPGSSSDGGGSGGGLGNVATAPAMQGSAATAGTPFTAGNSLGGGGGVYGGGGGGTSRAAGSAFNPLLGGDSSGLSASGAHNLDFNGTRDPASGLPTAGTTDPSDYFTRTGERDNIFKVVERRYQKTTMNWAQTPVMAAPVKVKK